MIPDITYFILDYNPSHRDQEFRWLKDCLMSVYHNTDSSLNKMVYVVSQGAGSDHEESVTRLSRFFGFNVLCMRENVGISRGVNHCVQMSRSPVVALVTSDTFLTKGMDMDLWCKIMTDNNIVHATPLTQKSDIPYQQLSVQEEFGSDIVILPGACDIPCIAYELTVNFWSKKIFDDIGFFDERWKACYENLDFALRCFMWGGENIVSGSSFVWHRHGTCYHNGLLDHAYDGYMDNEMPNGLDHTVLRRLWDSKWPSLNSIIDVYQPIGSVSEIQRRSLLDKFRDNIYLPYRQNVGY